MKVRGILKLLKSEGWELARTKESHRQFRHPDKPGLVTVSGHPGDEIAPGTYQSILKQLGHK